MCLILKKEFVQSLNVNKGPPMSGMNSFFFFCNIIDKTIIESKQDRNLWWRNGRRTIITEQNANWTDRCDNHECNFQDTPVISRFASRDECRWLWSTTVSLPGADYNNQWSTRRRWRRIKLLQKRSCLTLFTKSYINSGWSKRSPSGNMAHLWAKKKVPIRDRVQVKSNASIKPLMPLQIMRVWVVILWRDGKFKITIFELKPIIWRRLLWNILEIFLFEMIVI